MSYVTVEKILLGLTLLVGVFSIFTGITFLADSGDGAEDFGSITWGVLAVCVGGMILAGVYVTTHRPWLGAGLVSAGGIAVPALTFWMLPVTTPLALVLIAGALFRARGVSRARLAIT